MQFTKEGVNQSVNKLYVASLYYCDIVIKVMIYSVKLTMNMNTIDVGDVFCFAVTSSVTQLHCYVSGCL